MKAMRDQFPWLTIPETILSEIETGMPQFLLQEAAGRGKKLMRCTACGCGGIHEPVARNRGMGVCPFCMETVEAVDHTRLRSAPGGEINGLRRGADVMIFRAVDGILWGIDARAWRSIIRNSFDGPDVYTDVALYVHSVYRFEPGCAEQYKWELRYAPETEHGWRWGWGYHATPIEPTNQGYMGMKDGTYAVYGLQDALEQTSCRYCGIDDYFEALGETLGDGSEVRGVIRDLRAWCKRPKLELAVKWGIMDVAQDFVDNGRTWGRVVNWKKDTPWEFLKIRKADWKWYRGSRYATVELLDLNRKVFHMPLKDLLAFADSQPGHRWMDKAEKLCRRGVPLPQQIKYLDRQSVTGDYSRSAGYWLDYLEMAEQLGRDVSADGAVMPRNLIEAHEQMVDLRNRHQEELRLRELKKRDEGYAKRKAALEKKYAFRSGDLEIRVPQGAADIIREGNVLKICVGGYAARHLDGKTTILFLRHARRPDRPYVCIEIDEKTNRIIQIHGYRNERYKTGDGWGKSPMDRHRDFISAWLAWVNAGSRRKQNVRKEETA